MKTIPDNFSFTEHSGTVARNLNGSISAPGELGKTLCYLILLICVPGLLGNGIVIRYLGFWLKRTSFTVYILNLAVADIGSLIFLFLTGIFSLTTMNVHMAITVCFIFTYCTGQFLLTIISIDRCLALFFPIWHRCHQPPYLSTILCTIAWIVSILFCGIHYILSHSFTESLFQVLHVFIFSLVGILLMLVSSLALLIKGYLQSRMKRRRKLLTAILLALFFFLILSVPSVVIYLMAFGFGKHHLNLLPYAYLCPCLNSSVNPLIYFVLGRKKEHHSPYDLKTRLQTLFKEEEEGKEQSGISVDS
ncbi:proto-oncogene Mas-like [Thamnophis elegans]|uniref:proto-oncogene Mas-like n=1 Tax=Thamnophis elegans TaxID=35005 RepID=UPI0013784D34|nr:proto-oncogene Mas-like [Thamnophis elegans]